MSRTDEQQVDQLENEARINDSVLGYHRVFPWPGLLYAAGCLATFFTVSILSVRGTLPLGLGFAINTYALIIAFTPLHEAVHQNLTGRKASLRWLNAAIGHATGAILLLAFPLFRVIHLSHHGSTNDPALDPDYWLKSRGVVELVGKLVAMIPHYLLFYVRHTTAGRGRLVASFVDHAACIMVYGAPVALCLAGYGRPTLLLWVGPAIIAVGLLSLMHWTLHLPHDSRERYLNAGVIHTRKWFSAPLRLIYQDQQCHLIHHLFPRIPVHLQRVAFERIRPELEAKGAHITEL